MSARRGGMAPRNAAFPAVVITRLHVRRHPGFRHRDSSPTRCVKAAGWSAGQVSITAGFRPNATHMTPRAFLAMRACRHGLCHAVLHTVTRASTAHPEVTVRQTTHPTHAPSAVDHCRERACRGCAALAPTTVCRPVASMLKRKRRDAGSAGVRAFGVVDSLPLPTQQCCACRIIGFRYAAGNAYKPRVTSDAHADSPGSPDSRGCAPSAGLLRPRCLRQPRSPPAACPWR